MFLINLFCYRPTQHFNSTWYWATVIIYLIIFCERAWWKQIEQTLNNSKKLLFDCEKLAGGVPHRVQWVDPARPSYPKQGERERGGASSHVRNHSEREREREKCLWFLLFPDFFTNSCEFSKYQRFWFIITLKTLTYVLRIRTSSNVFPLRLIILWLLCIYKHHHSMMYHQNEIKVFVGTRGYLILHPIMDSEIDAVITRPKFVYIVIMLIMLETR